MSKKYSSNDKDRLLCETFRAFVQSEAWEQDPNPRARSGDKVWRGMGDGPGWKSRERNAGVEHEYGHDDDYEAPVQVSAEEEAHISAAIDEFLEKMNSNSEGWWPQTWVGGGRVWTGSDYRQATEEEAAKVVARTARARKNSGRDPFTREHIATDLASNNHSAFTGEKDEEGNGIPSVFLFVLKHLVPQVATDLGRSETEVQNMIELIAGAAGGESQ